MTTKQYQIHLPNKADFTAAVLFLEARGFTSATHRGKPMGFVEDFHHIYPWLVLDDPKESTKPTYGANEKCRSLLNYISLHSLTELFELILNPAPRPVEVQLGHSKAVVGPNGVTVGCTTFGFDKLDEIVGMFGQRTTAVGQCLVTTDSPRRLSWPGGWVSHSEVLAVAEAAKQFRS